MAGEPRTITCHAHVWFSTLRRCDKFKVVTVTREVSGSRHSSRSLNDATLTDDTAALLQSLGIARAYPRVSFGGFVAQEFALAFRPHAHSLCCTSFGGPKHVSPSMDILTVLSTNVNTEEDSAQPVTSLL
jgi:pimeloyl-ACP methyl ester carboxylesterase